MWHNYMLTKHEWDKWVLGDEEKKRKWTASLYNKVDLDLMGRSEHYSVSSHPPMLVLAWVLHDVLCWIGQWNEAAWWHAEMRPYSMHWLGSTKLKLEWQSVMLVSSLSKLGNQSRLYKIVILKHKLLDIQL